MLLVCAVYKIHDSVLIMKCPLSLVVWFLRLAPQSPVGVVNEIEMFDSPSLTHFTYHTLLTLNMSEIVTMYTLQNSKVTLLPTVCSTVRSALF